MKYMQTDSRWGGLGYPKSPYYIRNCGCGECAIANIIIETDKYANYTPATIQPYCKQYADPKGNGTYWSGIPAMLKHYGLTEVKEHATMTPLWNELAKGNRVAVYLMGSKLAGSKKVRWTSSGHFVCSTGYKYENGKHYVYVKDSCSNSNLRNGWITYEENMRNDILKVWSAVLPAKAKPYTPTTPYTGGLPNKVVKKGSKGTDVKHVQKFLNWCIKAGLSVDGSCGPKTTAAIKKYQKQYKLKVDGVFGSQSKKKAQSIINAHKPKPAPAPSKTWVDKANAWAKAIANGKYHYVVWKPKVNATHTCPICTGRKYDNYYGWNCIGFASAVWHHGGGLKSTCNCHTITNEDGEKMYKAKTDAEALAIAKKKLGLTSLTVIRNKSGIPKSQWKAGDICLQFKGNTYKHMFYYMGGGQIADSSRTSKVADNIKVRSYKNYSAKIIIRYTGK